MAKVKGTWRFNDVLIGRMYATDPEVSDSASVYVSFQTEYSGMMIDCTGFLLDPDENDVTRMDYYLSDEYAAMLGSDNATVYVNSAWNGVFGESVKTVVFPTEQEVSDEFYAWLTANAVEQVEYTVSGKWRFNDVLTQYGDAGVTYEIPVSFKAIVNGDVPVEVTCNKMVALYVLQPSVEMMLMYGVSAMNPDISPSLGTELPADFYVYNNGWHTADFSEGIKTVDFGTEPQTVSSEFYDWLAENAVQQSAFVWYNGATVARLFGGETATLKCAGMKMETNVVVEALGKGGANSKPVLQEKTATENGEVLPDEEYDGLSKVTVAVESSGGCLAINGIIEQYKVNAGATVNAGDFVEFVTKLAGTSVPLISSTNCLDACKIDDDRVLFVFCDSSDVGEAVVLTFESNDITASNNTKVFHRGKIRRAKLSLMSENKAIVVYYDVDNSCTSSVILTIDGNAIVAGSKTVLSDGQSGQSIVALSETKAVAAYRIGDNFEAVVLTVDGMNITVGTSAVFYVGGTSAYPIRNILHRLDESNALVVYTSYTKVSAAVLTVDGTNITVGASVTIRSGTDKPAVFSSVKLNNTKFLVVYTLMTNTSTLYFAVVLSVDGANITYGDSYSIHTSKNDAANDNSMVALSESKALIVYDDFDTSTKHYTYHASVLTVDGTSVSAGTSATVMPDSDLKSTFYSLILLPENKARFIQADYGKAPSFFDLLINDTTVIPVETTFAQPATSRDFTGGLAKTGGAEGETVDVYVVG